MDTGLLLHYQSHVGRRYKEGLVKTMIDHVIKLSSTKLATKSIFRTLNIMNVELNQCKCFHK